MDATLPILVAAIGLCFALAGFVKGMTGLGLPTVAIGLLGLVMAPVQALGLLLLPSLVTNLWQLIAGPHLAALLQRLWPMLAGICVGTAGAAALEWHDGKHAVAWLGLALTTYAVLGLLRVRFYVPPAAEDWLAPLIGACTGAVTVATGVFVLPAVPYLQSLDMGKDELVQAMGLSFSVSTLTVGVALFGSGVFQASDVPASAAALAPALVGMFIGQRLRARVPETVFRTGFFLALLALGAHLALKPIL